MQLIVNWKTKHPCCQPTRKRKYIVSLALTSLMLFTPQEIDADITDKVIRALKGVAWVALEVGIEEAGSRLFGSTIWGYVKKFSEPVFNEFLSSEEKPSETEVVQVSNSLDNDTVLRQNIRQQFDALPREERDSVLRKIDEIQEQLDRIERVTVETNLDVKEIKQLLLSILRTPTLAGLTPSPHPENLHRFDALDSLLSIYYPQNLREPRRFGNNWIAGAHVGKGFWKSLWDIQQPWIFYSILGVGVPEINLKDQAIDMARKQLTEQSCDQDEQKFPVQELLDQEVLLVAKCDRPWPAPNSYVPIRLFYSNGALIYINAFIPGDDSWKEYKDSVLSSMRWTRLRRPCGFYDTACCLPTGARACESGLTCKNKRCLPRSPGRID